MKLLLDMGLSPASAKALRSAGHDAVHLRERGQQRRADEDILQDAVREDRVVVTFDLDFPQIIALQRRATPSVILFRLEAFTTAGLTDRLIELLQRYRDPLETGALVVVDPTRVRVRDLPIW